MRLDTVVENRGGQKVGPRTYRASSTAITLLIAFVYLLSSVVYWILYPRLQLSTDMARGNTYKRFRSSVSSLGVCGQYSGLAVCPVVN